jgi:hypothetical protein
MLAVNGCTRPHNARLKIPQRLRVVKAMSVMHAKSHRNNIAIPYHESTTSSSVLRPSPRSCLRYTIWQANETTKETDVPSAHGALKQFALRQNSVIQVRFQWTLENSR